MPKPYDLVGRKFERLSVTSRVGRRGGDVYWACTCDCGKKVEVGTKPLLNTRTKSCGCYNKDNQRSLKILPAGFAARNIILNTYRGNAARRGLEWRLSEEEFMRITDSNCHYCGTPPSNRYTHMRKDGREKLNGAFVYSGIDRVNNDVGYIDGNCVPCCGVYNMAKRAMPYQEFMTWIGKLIRHQGTLAVGS